MSNKQLANPYSRVQFRSIFICKYFTKYPRVQVTATQVLTGMITSEMIKALDETGVKIIHKLVNDIYKTGVIPTSMNESIFICLPKKPKATMCTEYRTLSLMSHVLKVILKVILLRNKQKIENEISNLQSGFMSGKGTREGIFNMRMLCE